MNLIIRWFHVISKTYFRKVSPLCWDAVRIFYSPNQWAAWWIDVMIEFTGKCSIITIAMEGIENNFYPTIDSKWLLIIIVFIFISGTLTEPTVCAIYFKLIVKWKKQFHVILLWFAWLGFMAYQPLGVNLMPNPVYTFILTIWFVNTLCW